MKVAVISHKRCWASPASRSGYVTAGGFPFQVQALSVLFDSTTLAIPCYESAIPDGAVPLTGHQLSIAPLTPPIGKGIWRKLTLPFWIFRNITVLATVLRRADAVHAIIPGDVGTVGMALSYVLRKPLFVRHSGNWLVRETVAERFWAWFMRRIAGGRNVMLATGGGPEPPSGRNPNVRWIFSTSLHERDLQRIFTPPSPPANGRVRLLTVSRQELKKGTGVVIQSLPEILKEFPDVTLDVVGDGSALPHFREVAATLQVDDRTIFHGAVGHATVLRLLREADIFCYPTVASEGFPKVVLEAMASGLPVVTTRVSVLPELIGDSSGVLIDAAEPDAVAEAVNYILSDPVRYASLSTRATETAQQYSLERWRDTIRDALEEAWGPLRTNK